MIGRLAGLRGQLSSRWLASAFVLGYLVISITVGVSLLTAPNAADGATTPVALTPPPLNYQNPSSSAPMTPAGVPGRADDSATVEGPTPTTTTTAPRKSASPSGVPAGYQSVTGPAGMRTVIPSGWRTQRSSGPGAMQAVDPADADRYVKYGGSSAPLVAIESSHIQYENGFAIRAVDYRRIKLDSASYAGHDAVEWEFEHRDGNSTFHVRSLYWRADGKEYFVLVAAPAARWTDAKTIYDTMIAHATP